MWVCMNNYVRCNINSPSFQQELFKKGDVKTKKTVMIADLTAPAYHDEHDTLLSKLFTGF